MDVTKGNIKSVLNGEKQYTIPVYQRTYSWEKDQYKRLWSDILDIYQSHREGHFVGTIVTVAEKPSAAGVSLFLIIDGQQRITSMTLIYIALRDYLLANPDAATVNPSSLDGNYIQNVYCEKDDRYKLMLTRNDKDVLQKLIDHLPMDSVKASRVWDAYKFFYASVKGAIEKNIITAAEILECINRLQVANVTLERGKDDPQLIFESLNSTGMALSETDLIRNYIFMRFSSTVQENIYNSYWSPTENLFSYEKRAESMDRFFRDFLSVKLKRIPKQQEVYENFKKYLSDFDELSVEIVCKSIYDYALLYTNMIEGKSGDEDIDRIFLDIKELRMEVSYPFILKVYRDYSNNVISKADFCEILRLCEAYVFRRLICSIPTNSLNNTFISFLAKIDPVNYVVSCRAFLALQVSYKAFPTDSEFVEAFVRKDIYNMNTRNYILRKLENYKNKSVVNISAATIEHILPQNPNLKPEWRTALGDNWEDIQKEYVHTIGNLTLTAYNTEMSDRPFLEKRDMPGGFIDCGLRLNSYVKNQSEWNQNKIQERAYLLSKIALDIWKSPDINQKELAYFLPKKEAAVVYDLNSYDYLEGNSLDLFNELDKRIMNISSDVFRECMKTYIAYKLETNFVDIEPRKSFLRVVVNMPFDKVYDPKSICNDVTDIGTHGNGDVLIRFSDLGMIDDIMDIIHQSYNRQISGEE